MAEVKGTGIMEQQAREGLKLFEPEAGPAEVDVAGAEAHKAKIDAQIAALDAQVAALTGKDNKKERTAKSKEISDLKVDPQYIDACKVVKGLEPKNGHFVKSAPAVIKKAPAGGYSGSAPPVAPPPAPKKDDKKASKKQESAGLSPAEKKELESLKTDIVARKTELKNQGLSGGQQNKDEKVVAMVKRMNELKEKEEPGSTAPAKKETKKSSKAPLSSEEQRELDKLRGEIEVYKHKLKTEFGYSAKDMKIDEDLQDMEKRLAELEKRS
jgi:hypothetical protein